MTTSRKLIDDTFALLERAAAAGDRCPQNYPFGPLHSQYILPLCREGRIKVEVYGRNFRRVTILAGPHAGRSTAPPADASWKPYKVIGLTTERNYRARQVERKEPSLPKILMAG